MLRWPTTRWYILSKRLRRICHRNRRQKKDYIIGGSESEIVVAIMGSIAAKKGWKKGPWTHEEDKLLSEYVSLHGEGRWSSVAMFTGLNRSGKSCRLRWVNYLRPGLKKGQLTTVEEGIIIELHAVWGNKWSTIARYLPGRTDNEIKNYWRTHFKKKEKSNRNKKLERRREKVVKHLKQEQQVEEQPQEYDFKSFSSQEETNYNETKSYGTKENNDQQDMGFMCPNPPTLEQQNSFPLLHQEFSSSWPDSTVDYEALWFSLWDFDVRQGFEDHVIQLSKCVMPNQATFRAGGAPMQNLWF